MDPELIPGMDDIINYLQEQETIIKELKQELNQYKSEIIEKDKTIEVFTTRPDTLFGASFIALSPEHQICAKYAKKDKEVKNFIEI